MCYGLMTEWERTKINAIFIDSCPLQRKTGHSVSMEETNKQTILARLGKILQFFADQGQEKIQNVYR